KALRLAVAEPALEAEGCELKRAQPIQQSALHVPVDELFAIPQASNEWRIQEQVHVANSSFSLSQVIGDSWRSYVSFLRRNCSNFSRRLDKSLPRGDNGGTKQSFPLRG